MSPGFLIIEIGGDEPRQVPVRLLPDFQTQLYVIYQERPLFADMRVLTVPFEDIMDRARRDPYDRGGEFEQIYEHVDSGLVALNNQGLDIGDRLVNRFLNSKFRNPSFPPNPYDYDRLARSRRYEKGIYVIISSR